MQRKAVRLALGTFGAAIGAILGAIAWAAISSATGYQIGYVAIGVGFLAGFGMLQLGGGRDPADGAIAGLIALCGCVLGNIFVIAVEASKELHQPLGYVAFGLLAQPALAFKMLQLSTSPMDFLFYAFAAYAGYRTALKPAPQPVAPAPPAA